MCTLCSPPWATGISTKWISVVFGIKLSNKKYLNAFHPPNERTCSMLLEFHYHHSYGIYVISHSPTSLSSNTFDIHSWEHIQLWSWDCFYSCYLYTQAISWSQFPKCTHIFSVCAVCIRKKERCSIMHTLGDQNIRERRMCLGEKWM